MRKTNTIWLLVVMMALSSSVFAQVTIKGRITDKNSNPIIGATVSAKSSNGNMVGAMVDLKGNYQLRVNQNAPFELKASSMGYSAVTKTVSKLSGEVTVDFVLSEDDLDLDEVVVTGVVNSGKKLTSSVSVSTLKMATVELSAPRTTAEIFRTIPGIRSEASGGDGNTNITARGVPISAGGAKYLQLQEDGLPILLYGDIAFATADIFLRADQNIARIEAVRGGAASTMASNSPAGLINFISKTGAVQGGSLSTTIGLDYSTYRTDFDYGSSIGNGLRFHMGGFFRTGEGIRSAGYNDNIGGQFKANMTKQFKKGYARIYFKYLNDRTSAYMPMPIAVTGTNAHPTWKSINGFSATLGGLQSVYLQSNYGLGPNGERRRVDITDGMHPVSTSVGTEFAFDLGSGFEIKSKSRFSLNSGRFEAPFTAMVGKTSDVIAALATQTGRDLTGATLTYAHNGKPFTGNLAQIINLFDTELNNFNNFFNDTKLNYSIDNFKLSAGMFKAYQKINMSWLWNNYLMEVKGVNAGLIDVTMADSTKITESGQTSYGPLAWGNCCTVQYDADYSVTAPYFAASFENDLLSADVSVRYEMGKVRGNGSGTSISTIDMNNDGIIEPIEEKVASIDDATKHPVNYDYNYLSYSLGASYKLNENNAVFGRFSRGGSAKADRIIWPGANHLSVGNPKDMINQGELGWKSKFGFGGLYVTAFYAKTIEEGGFEATTQKVIKNNYLATGLELETALKFGDFSLRGGATYTHARISDGDNKGNVPRRQPALMFNLLPSYSIGRHSFGFSFIGQTKAYTQDVNQLVIPGYLVTNFFVNLAVTKDFYLSLNGNNLFNVIGITEAEEGSIDETAAVNYIRGRSILGRSISATLRYNF